MTVNIDNPFRTVKGGLIDRENPFDFSFDGVLMQGYRGDTLASALLANGIHLTARSFKYHRPRGIMTAGSEEPNALVTIRSGGRREPNTRATMQELYDGLEAVSQNRWPSLGFDVLGINDWVSRFLPAGFYYKTFMGPHKSWWYNLYEPFIRRAAGLGKAGYQRDPDHYGKMHGHCDVLVVGAGPTGLTAARALAEAGKKVILADENPQLGGQCLWNGDQVDDQPASEWAARVTAALKAMPNVRVLSRTTVFGAYDSLTFGAVERVCDHMAEPVEDLPQQRFWFITARSVVYATGSIERPLVMDGNDRPGVMMAAAAHKYLNQFAVVPGKRVAIATNNDSAYAAAADLATNSVDVAAVIDVRKAAGTELASQFDTKFGACVHEVRGGTKIKSAAIASLSGDALGKTLETLAIDALLMSGGWTPNVHLMCHKGGKPVWNEALAAMVPGELPANEYAAGSVTGAGTTATCIDQGLDVVGKILGESLSISERAYSRVEWNVEAFWKTPGSKRGFVEFQNDATAKDIDLAVQEGYKSVEHMKRYTTLGMATDQGKMANINGLALLSKARQQAIPEVGTTTYRPPFTPFGIGAVAGHRIGKRFVPTRYTSTHRWAENKAGAVMTDAGLWKRAQWFHQEGDKSWIESCNREVLNTRNKVGLNDVSTLGKIDIQGPDAGEFLNRLYTNGFAKLPVGKARYGMMLREDGSVMDDGTTSRLSENHYYMTTTTAAAGAVISHMEYYHQAIWPSLKVQFTSVTDQWSAFAVAGPRSRDVLRKVVEDLDLSHEAFPFMAVADCTVLGGKTARLFRISFSGELAYEIAVDARYGQQLWDALMAAGEEFGIAPYGLEALNVMRIEKGHVTHAELDGRVSIADTGLGKMASTKKDFIGRVATTRPAYGEKGREQLVGLRPVGAPTYGLTSEGQPDGPIMRAGTIVYGKDGALDWQNMQGWVSSVCYSPMLQGMIGLAFVTDGHSRLGETVRLHSHLHEQRGESHAVEVELVSGHFFDPENERLLQ